MKKLANAFGLLCLFCFIISGCTQEHPKTTTSHGIVVGIDIYCQHSDSMFIRNYTDPEKLEAVLTYLRLLQPVGPAPLSSDAKKAASYKIVVHLQDGTHRTHLQQSDCFAALDQTHWGVIDRSLGQQLPLLMALLPSDLTHSKTTFSAFFSKVSKC